MASHQLQSILSDFILLRPSGSFMNLNPSIPTAFDKLTDRSQEDHAGKCQLRHHVHQPSWPSPPQLCPYCSPMCPTPATWTHWNPHMLHPSVMTKEWTCSDFTLYWTHVETVLISWHEFFFIERNLKFINLFYAFSPFLELPSNACCKGAKRRGILGYSKAVYSGL